MKNLIYSLLFIFALSVVSCSDDDDNPSLPNVAIENLSDKTSIAQEDTIYLKAKISSSSASSFSWSVDGEKIANATDSVFNFVSDELGLHTITLSCKNNDGETSDNLDIEVYGKYKYGTFVLNEGNMTSENGTLIFISPNGVVTDSAFFKVNGTELGNSTQDLFITDNKIYIISQSGKRNPVGSEFENEGKLVIANAETLKKEASYNDELSALSWPTHIAVLGNETFIRDNNGIYSFNTSTKELNFIEGSVSALKNRMAVAEGKIFVPANKAVLVIESGKREVSHKIEMDATITGVIKTSDNNIYISTTGTPNKITKINAKNYSIIKENEITEGSLGAGWGASPGISAKGDTIYYSNASTKIYRHIFSSATSEFMVNVKDYVENANIVYNNLAVNPVTGEVYFNTLKAYGQDYLINNISVFNFQGEEPVLSANYKDYTNFPAGIFFTYDFE